MSYHIKTTKESIYSLKRLLKIKSTSNKYNSSKVVYFYRVIGNVYIVPFAFGRKFSRVLPFKIENVDHLRFTGKLRIQQISMVNEAIEFLDKSNSVLLALRPGQGKTVISINLVTRYLRKGFKALVLVKSRTLQSQWLKSINMFSNAKSIMVPAPSCTKKDEQEYLSNVDSSDILVCMYTRIKRLSSKTILSIDILIIDEADEFCTKDKVNSLLTTKPSYVICATATPEREDGMHRMLRCMCGYNDVKRSNDDPNLTVTKVNMPFEPDIEINKKGDLMWTTMTNSLLRNDERNAMIVDLTIDCVEEKDKVLILTDRIYHPEVLENMIKEKNNTITIATMFGDKESYIDSQVLIATKHKLGRAFDVSTFATDYDGVKIDTLIMAITVKSSTSLIQSVGRVQRANFSNMYFLVDNHSCYRKHWILCRDLYKERKATIREITL
uniref:A18-like helicase n=1 Tax=Pithovirus LCPAC403 TaxID=2506596 RepID=A0A481ZCA7_9VIRU|nr:MAG: A18-like helicase [Pithovirus LCPAC403]